MREDPQGPEAGQDDVLEITWDDLKEVPAAPAAGAEYFPAISAADAAVAGSRLPWVDVEAVCARDGGAFGVRFQQAQPGVYTCVGVTGAPAKGPGGKAPGLADLPGAGEGQVSAQFSLAGYTGCPRCGLPAMFLCDRCGTIMCGSALRQDKRGDVIVCPRCGGKGRVDTGAAVTVQGQVGGMKGAKGGGKGR